MCCLQYVGGSSDIQIDVCSPVTYIFITSEDVVVLEDMSREFQTFFFAHVFLIVLQ